MNVSTVAVELTPEIRSRRVAVMEDMVAQIRAGEFRPMRGTGFLTIDSGRADYPDGLTARLRRMAGEGADLRDVLPEIGKFCVGCFRGGAMLAKARVFDAVPLSLVVRPEWDSEHPDVSLEDTDAALADIFDPHTLAVLEAAFEVTAVHATDRGLGEYDSGPMYAAAVFGSEFADSKERALAVAANLIANRGELVVPAVTFEEYLAATGEGAEDLDDDDDFDDDEDEVDYDDEDDDEEDLDDDDDDDDGDDDLD